MLIQKKAFVAYGYGKTHPQNSQLIGSEKGTGIFGVHPWRLTLAPENQPLEKEIPIGNHHFWGSIR